MSVDADDDGVNDDVAANLPTGAGDPWSMNVWTKLSESLGDLEYVAGFGDRHSTAPIGATRTMISGITPGDFYFWGRSCDLSSGEDWISDNQWHMYTVTYDGSSIEMFIDAGSVKTASRTLTDALSEVHVGNPSTFGEYYFRGQIDEFTIWDTELTQTEINNLIPEPSPIVLLATGGLVLVLGLRRRKRSKV